MSRPFRWNIAKREQLGELLSLCTDPLPLKRGFLAELREVSARILAYSGASDLVFIGRSPENFYDYLSGVFNGLEGVPDLRLLQFSMRWAGEGGVDNLPEHHLDGLFSYFSELGLTPSAIATSQRPIALVDFVAHGGTMENLMRLFHKHSDMTGTDWNAVQRRLRIIGLRARTKNSPNTHRWQQHQHWLHLIPDVQIMNVSVTQGEAWYLMNYQDKVTSPFTVERWADDADKKIDPRPENLRALKYACDLYDCGNDKRERQRLVSRITREPQIKQSSVRALIRALKG